LGSDFDSPVIEAIVQQSVTSQPPAEGTSNRNQKCRRPQKIKRRPFARHLETVTTVVDYAGDKTELKPMGKKKVGFPDTFAKIGLSYPQGIFEFQFFSAIYPQLVHL